MTVDLPALRKLLRDATPRPWHIERGSSSIGPHISGIVGPGTDEHGSYTKQIVETDAGVYGPEPADAELLTAAVNSLEPLLECWAAAERYMDASRALQVVAKHGGAGLSLCVEIERARNEMFAAIDRARNGGGK